ncbi:integral membrane protein GPR155 [Amazona aestiva]|uniref:Integral membrane protein GPR155 n=1 Tax=Amazona aestiva TaxID=12930 RepID=A0A0Q3U264_AMAAE|nr:integral membrane protein GPR155 [Amazona aestiva]
MDSYSDFSAENLSTIANMSVSLPGQIGLNATGDTPSMSISRLFPALLECFGIILCGYIAGRANIITSTQAKGLGNFVSRFALPALLFKNMVVLNFSNVHWSFLYSILIAKAAVFFLVCILTLLVASPENRFSKAGLFPIFATQSNDFALGYPIVEALYQTTYPEYLQYIYLVAPISLMMLNPLGFILCEIQKWRNNRTVSHSKIKIVGLALLRVLQNPIVFMVFIGIASNFILGQKIPEYLENFLDGLGSSFSGSALFYLGLTMVGQTKKLTKGMFVALILLITAKLLMMPFLCREMVELLDKSDSIVNHTSLSNYAFLYGVFPAAPGVAIFASQFNMEVGIITSGMVISTFVSAPIMYVSAWLLTIPSMDPNPLASALQNVSFDISIVSLICLFIACIGMVAWNFIVKDKDLTVQILVFIFLYSSLYSTYLWTGFLSFSLFLLRKRETVKIPIGFIIIAGWGVPTLLVGILLIVGEHNSSNIDSAFFYGKYQIITTAVVLFVSILMSGISLMCMNRNRQESSYEVLNPYSPRSQAEEVEVGGSEGNRVSATVPQPSPGSSAQASPGSSAQPSPGSSAQPSAAKGCCSCQTTNGELSCAKESKAVSNAIESKVLPIETESFQLFVVAVQPRAWKAGFICFGIFGLDKHLIILPFKRRLEFFWGGREAAGHTDPCVPEEIRMTCQQFVRYHRDHCVKSIVKGRRCGAKISTGIFFGCDLVNWLMQVGLASDRGEAVVYGDRLMKGGVIQHITNEFEFRDEYLYYRFIPKRSVAVESH